MIAEVFLTCAMALPAQGGSYRPLVQGDMQVVKMLGSFWEKEHHDNGHSPTPKAIVWNPYRAPVSAVLRLAGLQVWDLTPLPPETEYAIQGELLQSPIRRESIHLAWSLERIMDGAALCAMKAMVATGGFLIVELEDTWMHANLVSNHFEFLPFKWHGYSIYRKRNGRGYAAGNGNDGRIIKGEFALQRSA